MIKSFDDILAFRKEFAELTKSVEGCAITQALLADIDLSVSRLFLKYGLKQLLYTVPTINELSLRGGRFFIKPMRIIDELALIALFNTERENMNVVRVETF
jgi:hypothetical protein